MYWIILLLIAYFVFVSYFKKNHPEQYQKNMDDNKRLARAGGETMLRILSAILKK